MAVAIPPTERAELAALADFVSAAGTEVAAALGVSGLRTGNAFALACAAVPAIEVNRALGVTAADELDEIEAFFHERSESFAVSPIPGVDLDEELERRGYAPGYRWMKFSRRTDRPPRAETTLHVREVGAEGAADFGTAFCASYGLPDTAVPWIGAVPGRDGWTCVVSYDGTRPVGAGALFVDGDAGWLGMAATLPEARGRGSQTAILAYRIAAAAEQGCPLVVTETGERVGDRPSASYRNILRAGFEECYLRENYRAPKRPTPAP